MNEPDESPRFTLADLLKLTAFVAVALGVCSWLLPREQFRFLFTILGLNLAVGFSIAGLVWCLQRLLMRGAKNRESASSGDSDHAD